MRIFKRIRHEGVRRVFILLSATYAILCFFYLLFYGPRRALDLVVLYCIFLGGVLIAYLIVLSVQWVIAGFRKKE